MWVHESEELRDCLIHLSKFWMRNLWPRKGKWFSWCNLIALGHISDEGYYKWEEKWGSSFAVQSLYLPKKKHAKSRHILLTNWCSDWCIPYSIKDCYIEGAEKIYFFFVPFLIVMDKYSSFRFNWRNRLGMFIFSLNFFLCAILMERMEIASDLH